MAARQHDELQGSPREDRGNVRSLPFGGSDVEIVSGLLERKPQAQAAFFDRFAPVIRRVLVRVLGHDRDIEDLLQDVFLRALARIEQLSAPDKLSAWVVSIAVFTARGAIRYRRRRKWLRFVGPDDVPERPAPARDDEAAEALRATYRVLDELGTDERIVFALRHIDAMELTEVASACDCSLATIKRRLRRAEERFCQVAKGHDALDPWVAGARWRRP